jgi:hypothetical protein
MTLRQAQARLRAVGVTLTKYDGEYRVNVKGGMEISAYYTNDLDDAVVTGEDMAQRQPRSNPCGLALRPNPWAIPGAVAQNYFDNPPHIAGKLVQRYLETGRGGTSGPWAVVLHGDHATLRHYATDMLWFTRMTDPPHVNVLSTGHGSVSDQAGVNAALQALGSSKRFSRDRRGGGSRINPTPRMTVARAGELAARTFRSSGPPYTAARLDAITTMTARLYGLPAGDVYEMTRRWLTRRAMRDNPRRRTMARRYYDNPGGGTTMLLLVAAGAAAFFFLRPSAAAAGSLTTPPAVIPPGYTFVPGRGLVPTSTLPRGGTSTENQLIAAGIGMGAPLVQAGIGALFPGIGSLFGGETPADPGMVTVTGSIWESPSGEGL